MAEGGGFFRGTAQDQDNRFSDKMKKLIKNTSFPDNFNVKVNMKKVKLDVIKPWIVKKVTDMLQFEDEVVINFVFAQLENNQFPDPKTMQINITGFLEKNTPAFMKELWTLLVSAQKTDSGIPSEFLEKMKDDIRQKNAETMRVQAELAKKKAEVERKAGMAGPAADVKQESDSRESGGRDGGRGGDQERDRERDRDRSGRDRDDDRRRRSSRSRSRERERRRSPPPRRSPARRDRDDRDGRRRGSPPAPRDRSRDSRREDKRERRRGRSSSSESDRERKKRGRRRSSSRSRSPSASPRRRSGRDEAGRRRGSSSSSSSAGGSPAGEGREREDALRKKALQAAGKDK